MIQKSQKKLVICAILFSALSFESSIFVNYMSKSLPYSQIGILLSMNAFVVFVCEYLTGILSDRYGHKLVLVLSSAAFVLAEIIFVFSKSFIWFLIGLAIIGVSIAAQSGADIALLHDNMVDANSDSDKEKSELEFESTLCKLNSILNFANIAAVMIGSWISQYSIKYPFYLTIVCGAISFLIYSAVSDSRTAKDRLSERKDTPQIIKSANQVLFQNKSVFVILIISLFVFPIFHIIDNYSQIFMQDIGVPIQYFGIFYVVLTVFMSFGSKLTEWLKKTMKLNNLIVLCGIIISCCLMLYYFKSKVVFLLATAVIGLMFGIFYTANTLLISRNCEQSNRATVISSQHAFTKIAQFVYMTLFAFVTENQSVEIAFLLLGAMTVIVMIGISISVMQINQRKIKNDAK